MYENTRSNHQGLLPALTLALMLAVAILTLALSVKIGSSLITLFEANDVVAAPELTPTSEVPATVATSVEPTATALPTNTPVPPTPTATPPAPTPAPPSPRLVAGQNGVNVRSGPSTGYPKIGLLEPGAELPVTGRMGDWYQVQYEEEVGFVYSEIVTLFDTESIRTVTWDELPKPTVDEPIFTPAPVWTIDEPRWIDVDLSEQRLTAYEGRVPVQSYLVSTGLPATPTPEGQFRIWIKLRYDDMQGADYYLEDVPFVMYFWQGFGLHGVWWHGNWGHPMSHGCVNQPTEMAEWLFNFAEVGTLVNVHE